MKTSDSPANDGFCPECHNELNRDLSGNGWVGHKNCKFRFDRRGGVPLKDENGQFIPCTFGYGERDELILALDKDVLEQSTQAAIEEGAFDPRALPDARDRLVATIVS